VRTQTHKHSNKHTNSCHIPAYESLHLVGVLVSSSSAFPFHCGDRIALNDLRCIDDACRKHIALLVAQLLDVVHPSGARNLLCPELDFVVHCHAKVPRFEAAALQQQPSARKLHVAGVGDGHKARRACVAAPHHITHFSAHKIELVQRRTRHPTMC
jgi:hypothetical protein